MLGHEKERHPDAATAQHILDPLAGCFCQRDAAWGTTSPTPAKARYQTHLLGQANQRIAAGVSSNAGSGKHMHQCRPDSKPSACISECMPIFNPCVVQTAAGLSLQCMSCLAQFLASSSCRLSAQCKAQPSWASSSACNAVTQRCLARHLDMAVHSFSQASVSLYKHTIDTHFKCQPQSAHQLNYRLVVKCCIGGPVQQRMLHSAALS